MEQREVFMTVTIITAPIDSGKTTALSRYAKERTLYGCLTEKQYDHTCFTGYDLRFLPEGRSIPLIREQKMFESTKELEAAYGGNWFAFRRFYFNDEGFTQFEAFCRSESQDDGRIWVIDEIGPLELAGGGFAGAVRILLERNRANPIFLVVRSGLEEEVAACFSLEDVSVCRLNSSSMTIAF